MLQVSCLSSRGIVPGGAPFEVGACDFPFGDRIQIERVASSTGDFSIGSVLTVRGSYDLRSREHAMLYLGTTCIAVFDDRGCGYGLRRRELSRGQGTFEFVITLPGPGFPHVAFYDKQTGSKFGSSYFGSGDSLLTKESPGCASVIEAHMPQ